MALNKRSKHEEEEVDEQETPKPVKKSKPAPEPEPEEEDEEEEEEEESEDEVDEDFFNERLTPEDVKKVLTDRDKVPAGEYEGEVTGFKLIQPKVVDPKKGPLPGGIEISFKIVTAPHNVSSPEDGWPRLKRLFKKWPKPTEGQKMSQKIDKQDLYRLIIACGFSLTEEVELLDVVKELKGNRFLFTVTHRDGENGRTYQDIGRFKEA